MAIGPKHMLAKLIIVLVIAGWRPVVTFYKPMYHVTAPFQFVPGEKQAVSAPFEALVDTVGEDQRRAGPARDDVKEGECWLMLKTDELQDAAAPRPRQGDRPGRRPPSSAARPPRTTRPPIAQMRRRKPQAEAERDLLTVRRSTARRSWRRSTA